MSNVSGDIELTFTSGRKLTNLLQWSLDQEFTNPMDPLSFTYAAPRGKEAEFRELFQPGELVSMSIDGVTQVSNIIVDLREAGGSNGIVFTVTAESLLTIPMESSVDPDLSKTFKQETKISTIIDQVFAPYGLFAPVAVASKDDVAARAGRAISGADNDATLDPLKEKEAASKDGENSYPFVSRLLSRHGVQLRSSAEGGIMVVRPNYEQGTTYNLVQGADVGIEGTRVLAAPGPNIRTTNKGQFSHLLVRGKQRDGDKQTRVTEPYGFLEVPGTLWPTNAPFQRYKRTTLPPSLANYRPGAAPYKPKFWRDDEATDIVRCSHKAHQMHGVRAASGYSITVAVDGLLAHTGHIWTFDTIARIYLQDHGLTEDMWIRSTSKSGSKGSGQMTMITLIPKNSLILGSA